MTIRLEYEEGEDPLKDLPRREHQLVCKHLKPYRTMT